jgi:hypothetical protein
MLTETGLLAVGTGRGLSVYTLVLENDLPTWSQKWAASYASDLWSTCSYSDFKQSLSGYPCKFRPVPYVHRDRVQCTYSLEPLEAVVIS